MAQRYNKNGIPVDDRRPEPRVEVDFETALMVMLENLIDCELRIANALEKIVKRYENNDGR